MNWVPWDDTLRTGHAGMDADHGRLTELFNLLAGTVEQDQGTDACARLLDDIVEHTRAHFAQEEELMAQYHYPEREQHIAEHAMLIDQALGYRATFEADRAASPVAVSAFPEVWLAYHILFTDKHLADFLAQNA